MKVLKCLASILVITFMVGCQNENDVMDTQKASEMVFTASMERESNSRTGVVYDEENNKNNIVWLEGDLLSIFTGTSANKKYILSTGANTGSGDFVPESFSGSTESGSSSVTTLSANVAFYPYDNNVTITESSGSFTINATFPAEQTFRESGSIGNGALPMVAVASSTYDNTLSFKNVGGIFRIPLKGTAVITKIKFTATGKNLAGACSIVASNNSVPTTTVTTGSSTIILNCGNGVQLDSNTETNFVVAMLPVEIDANGLSITIYDAEGKYMTYTHSSEVKLERSTSKTTATVEYSGTQTVGVSEANEQLKAGDTNVTVNVTSGDAASGSSAKIELPANDSGNPTNLTFSAITEGASVTIAASTESNGGEAKEVNVSVPSSNTGYNFNINLPNSTVTLLAGEGSATFSEVTASTADNTLIIDAGVTVTTLKLKKGNVRLREGACVGSISLESDNSYGDAKPRIIYEGSKPTGFDSDTFELITAAEWDLIQAIENAEDGGYVMLENNVELSTQLTITKSLTLDLNGKTLSNTSDIWNDNEGVKTWSLVSVQGENVHVTIAGNGSLLAKENDCYAIDARDGAVVDIMNGTYVGNVSVVYAIRGGVINILGGTYSIQQLSKYNDYRYLLNLKDGDESSIQVTGGTFCNFDPANSHSENPIANFVAAGYSSIAYGANYVVTEGIKNESALIAAIASGLNEVTLSDNITLTSQLTITRSLTLNLNGKTISNTDDIWNDTNKTWSLISVQGESDVEVTINLNGGSLAAKNEDCFAVDVRGGAKVSIQGEGTVKGNISAVYAIAGGVANIHGGTYSIQQLSAHNDYRYLLNLKDGDESSIEVTGGTFCNFNPADCLAEGANTNFVRVGYSSVAGDDDTYTVSEGIKNESALIAAIASLEQVVLSDNITLTSQLTITRSLYLDLNGKTISNTSDIWNDTNKTWSLISVQGDSEADVDVLIDLNGGSLAAKENDCFAVDVRGGAKVSIQGEGTVKGNISAVYAIAGGAAIIQGGTYSIQQLSAHNDYRYLLNLKDNDDSSIQVTGGTFCNFNPANCLAEGEGTNFVVDGYESSTSDDGDTYVVTKKESSEE